MVDINRILEEGSSMPDGNVDRNEHEHVVKMQHVEHKNENKRAMTSMVVYIFQTMWWLCHTTITIISIV